MNREQIERRLSENPPSLAGSVAGDIIRSEIAAVPLGVLGAKIFKSPIKGSIQKSLIGGIPFGAMYGIGAYLRDKKVADELRKHASDPDRGLTKSYIPDPADPRRRVLQAYDVRR